MFDLLDDAALRTRAQLAADAHIAHLRTLARKRRPRVWLLVAVMWAFTLVGAAPVTVAASACETETSTRSALLGTDVAGCVWWGSLQGNGRGATVWNRPNG